MNAFKWTTVLEACWALQKNGGVLGIVLPFKNMAVEIKLQCYRTALKLVIQS